MRALTLADELVLLAYDELGAARINSPNLDYGLAGAVLVELALAGRIDVVDGKVVVTDHRPVREPLLDAQLARIVGDPKPRPPKHWVTTLGGKLRKPVLDGLAEAGILRIEKDTVLWVFPRTRYPAAQGGEAPAETAVRERLGHTIRASGATEPRTAALCALVRALNAEKIVFGDLPSGQVSARLKEITDGDWAGAATRKAIEEMELALMVAIMVPIIASTSSS